MHPWRDIPILPPAAFLVGIRCGDSHGRWRCPWRMAAGEALDDHHGHPAQGTGAGGLARDILDVFLIGARGQAMRGDSGETNSAFSPGRLVTSWMVSTSA